MPNDISAACGGGATRKQRSSRAFSDPEEQGLKDDEADMEMHECGGYQHPVPVPVMIRVSARLQLLRWKSRPSMRSGILKKRKTTKP
jgi:hypothetical protein